MPTAIAEDRSILDCWPDLVDARTGIVSAVKELFVDDDEPGFVHFLSTAADTAAFGFLANFGNNGGVGCDAGSAIAKALGEAVERYCSAVFDYADLRWASFAELGALGERAVNPAAFALYSPAQYAADGFPWVPFTATTRTGWVRGSSLVSGEPTWLPAGYVYVPYHYQRSRGDNPITQPISTGLACGSSRNDATLSALCEVIERDAFTVTWQAMLARPRIGRSGLTAELLDILARYAAVGLTVHLVDLTSDVGCPTLLSVAEGYSPISPALAVAAATHPDPAVAARKSLEELAHTRKFAAQVMDYLPPVPVDLAGGHPRIADQRDHLRFYCPQEAKPAAAFLWSGAEGVELAAIDTPPGGLDGLVAAVAGTGEDVYAVELTTPDVAELGLHVVRVVVPGFHPLHMGHANRCLGGHRLVDVPRYLGLTGRPPGADNPHPHPFP